MRENLSEIRRQNTVCEFHFVLDQRCACSPVCIFNARVCVCIPRDTPLREKEDDYYFAWVGGEDRRRRGRIRRTYRKREDWINHYSRFVRTSVSNQTDTVLQAWNHSAGRLILPSSFPPFLLYTLSLSTFLSLSLFPPSLSHSLSFSFSFSRLRTRTHAHKSLSCSSEIEILE